MSISYDKKFHLHRAALSTKIAAVIGEVATDLSAKIQGATPVRTGKLQGSISVVKGKYQDSIVQSDDPKAPFVEYGTNDTPVVGMFRRTFDANAVAMASKLERDVKSIIESI